MMTFLRRSVLSILSGLLITLSFPGWNLYWFIWVAFCPLIWAISTATLFQRFLLGTITGITSTLGIFYWIFEIDAFHWHHGIILTVYLSLFMGFWAVACKAVTEGGRAIFVAASLWVILEYLRANLGFLSLPWGQLSHSQAMNLKGLQIVALTGDYGLSFLIILFNGAFYQLFRGKQLNFAITAVFVLTLLNHCYGWFVLQKVEKQTLKVAVVQPNFNSQTININSQKIKRLELLQKMSLQLIPEQVDLLVWPETALRNLANNVLLQNELHSIVDFIGVPLVTGASEIGKFSVDQAKGIQRNYNSAFFLQPRKREIQRYDKIVLVPFAESIPLKNIIQWPDWVLPSSFDTTPGSQLKRFKIKQQLTFSVLICWENLFHDLLTLNLEMMPDFFIHISNLSWFGSTSASRQHNAISVLRAVEYGRPVIVASNSGPSQLISAEGVIIKKLDKLVEPGILVGSISLQRGRTLFSRFQNWFVWLCLISVIFMTSSKNN